MFFSRWARPTRQFFLLFMRFSWPTHTGRGIMFKNPDDVSSFRRRLWQKENNFGIVQYSSTLEFRVEGLGVWDHRLSERKPYFFGREKVNLEKSWQKGSRSVNSSVTAVNMSYNYGDHKAHRMAQKHDIWAKVCVATAMEQTINFCWWNKEDGKDTGNGEDLELHQHDLSSNWKF